MCHWIQSRHCQILSVHEICCWSVENCGHQSLKTAKIGIRTPLKSANHFRFVSQTIGVEANTFVSCTQNLIKIGKEFVDVVNYRSQIQHLHISKIQFQFPVSFTIEYKVGIAEFYPCVRFGADLLKNVVTRAWKLPKSESAHLYNRQTTSGFSHKQ